MTALILVAAGSGERLGAGIPKALVQVAGATLVGHCLATAAQVTAIADIVIVAPPAEVDRIRDATRNVQVVAGGASRDASVRNGLAALPAGTDYVLIHDAARPFTPKEVFERVVAALLDGASAVIPGIAVADTLKQVGDDGLVLRTVDRSDVLAVQTPQGFRVDALRDAHRRQTGPVTDDAMLMEHLGVPVRCVAGSPEAFKITTPFDLAVARAMKEV